MENNQDFLNGMIELSPTSTQKLCFGFIYYDINTRFNKPTHSLYLYLRSDSKDTDCHLTPQNQEDHTQLITTLLNDTTQQQQDQIQQWLTTSLTTGEIKAHTYYLKKINSVFIQLSNKEAKQDARADNRRGEGREVEQTTTEVETSESRQDQNLSEEESTRSREGSEGQSC